MFCFGAVNNRLVSLVDVERTQVPLLERKHCPSFLQEQHKLHEQPRKSTLCPKSLRKTSAGTKEKKSTKDYSRLP